MVAPKYSQNPDGRPPAFKSVGELSKKIESYFEHCDNRTIEVLNKRTGEIEQRKFPEPYTMSGLAYFLGVDRKTLVNYSKKDDYFLTIKNARARVEYNLEVRLLENHQPVGTIFNLKNNFAWIDEQKLDADIKTTEKLSPEAQAILAKASRAKGTND